MTTQVVNKNAAGKGGYDIYIGRPSKWGNPFIIGVHGDRATVISFYRQWLVQQPELIAALKNGELEGKTLGCFCKPSACHGDVLASASAYYTGGK